MKIKRKIWKWSGIVVGAMATAIIVASVLVHDAGKGRTYSDVTQIPHRKVALVLGCSRTLADGRQNLFFARRISATASLYKAGKVKELLHAMSNL